MEKEEKTQQPERILQVYEYLKTNSQNTPWSAIFGSDSGVPVIIWRGYGREVSEATQTSVNTVYKCLSTLEILGCIKKIKHGAYQSPGIYQLIKEPDTEEYQNLKDRSVLTDKLEFPSKTTRLQDSLNRLSTRVSELEFRLERIERGIDI